MISMIAALAHENAIGRQNDLLCYLPADLRHFKSVTTGHPVIMGRKTFESLPNGALPNRKNIVVSRNPELSFPGVEMVSNLTEAVAQSTAEEEVFIIGGASVYEAALPLADRMYLTFIDHLFEGADTFFPQWDTNEWREIAREAHTADEKNPYDYTFVTLERVSR